MKQIIESLNKVMAEMPSIAKDQTMTTSNYSYKYRGIEDITKHVQKLFAENGLVMVPKVLDREITEVLRDGKVIAMDVMLTVEYRLYHAEDNDSLSIGPMLGIGRDSNDKGANKAMTQAFKYALLQMLCISDDRDDGDREIIEGNRSNEVKVTSGRASLAQITYLKKLLDTKNVELEDVSDIPIDKLDIKEASAVIERILKVDKQQGELN